MKLRKLLLTLATGVLLGSTPAWAWWSGGHRAVGLLAQKQLSPETRKKLTAILASHPDGAAYKEFPMACVWPDDIKKKPGDPHHSWHYRDEPFFDGVAKHPFKEEGPNAVFALKLNKDVFSNPRATPAQKAVAMSWLGHVVGDVHQPLHACARCDKVHPNGDRGGNDFPLVIEGMDKANLHKLWDSAGLQLREDPTPEQLEEFVERIQKEYPRSHFQDRVWQSNPEIWLRESYKLAVSFVYPGVKAGGTPSQAYIDGARVTCERRIALAGYRLADLITEVLR